LEIFLLAVAWIAFLIPIVWIATPWLAFADYRLYLAPFLAGSLLLALGLWVFYRSHADLGTNWSVTLEIREAHRLVTDGVYRHVRHPMYAALLLYGLGQAILVPNWVVGPAYVVAMVVLCAFRLGPEEALMREHFKSAYDAYASRTKRLIPGAW
jgi:protein-S-isoprenylcysteine O-methyltransferase Ste14